MHSKEQRAILTARRIVLNTVEDEKKGSLPERLQLASHDIRILGAAVSIWVDQVAVQYKAMGCTQEEWQEDIRSWFVSQQFFIDDDVNDGSMLRCHLSNIGWGRHVILTFNLAPKQKRTK